MSLKASSIHVIALSIPGINAEAFRAGLVNGRPVGGAGELLSAGTAERSCRYM
jgi:hypothetical protein